jgi:hypothetical protein
MFANTWIAEVTSQCIAACCVSVVVRCGGSPLCPSEVYFLCSVLACCVLSSTLSWACICLWCAAFYGMDPLPCRCLSVSVDVWHIVFWCIVEGGTSEVPEVTLVCWWSVYVVADIVWTLVCAATLGILLVPRKCTARCRRELWLAFVAQLWKQFVGFLLWPAAWDCHMCLCIK